MATELEDSLARLCDRQRLKIEQLDLLRRELLTAAENCMWHMETCGQGMYRERIKELTVVIAKAQEAGNGGH